MFCVAGLAEAQVKPADPGLLHELSLYAGSKSCIECHGKFYQLWSTSRHGLAMQPYTPEFARANLTPQTKDLVIGKYRYRADIGPKAGWVLETDPKGKKKKYPILHALGGKNVYYFLTPLERGRLQTLPVAYDVRSKQWFDTAASGVRHFDSSPPRGAGPLEGVALHLQHRLLQLPCQPAQHQLRPVHRHLPHHLGGAGHQLRNLPRPLQGAQRRDAGRTQGAGAAGPEDHQRQKVHP